MTLKKYKVTLSFVLPLPHPRYADVLATDAKRRLAHMLGAGVQVWAEVSRVKRSLDPTKPREKRGPRKLAKAVKP